MKIVICNKDCIIDQSAYELIDYQIQTLKNLSKKSLTLKLIVQKKLLNQIFAKIYILGPKKLTNAFSGVSDEILTLVATVFENVTNFLSRANEKISNENKRKVSRLFECPKSSLGLIGEANSKFVFNSNLIGFGT